MDFNLSIQSDTQIEEFHMLSQSRLHLSHDSGDSTVVPRRSTPELGNIQSSSIHKLSTEILQMVFLWAHREDFMPNYLAIFGRVAAQVCSQWRKVSHSCAPLWTDIYCKIDKPVEKFIPMYGKLLEDSIHFAKVMPLTIAFSPRVTPELLGDTCVQALCKSVYQWKHANIMNEDLAAVIFSSIPKGMSMEYLETLYVRFVKKSFSDITAPKLRSLGLYGDYHRNPDNHFTITSAPSLEYLYVHAFYLPGIKLSGLNWTLIETFGASYRDVTQPEEFMELLNRMPNLTDLTLYIGQIKNITRSITLSNLTTLNVNGGSFGDIFKLLTTPCLNKLDIGHTTNILPETIVEFARRSGCTPEELIINGLHKSWLIPEFRSVKTLTLVGDRTESHISILEAIKQLTFKGTPSPDDIFPELENLCIKFTHQGSSWYEDNQWTVRPLIDMIKSRLRPRSSCGPETSCYLKSAVIQFIGPDLSDENSNNLIEFTQSETVRNSGVQVDVRFILASI